MKAKVGKFYVTKKRHIFVATGNEGCPRINVGEGSGVGFRDDFSKGFKVSKAITKKIFR